MLSYIFLFCSILYIDLLVLSCSSLSNLVPTCPNLFYVVSVVILTAIRDPRMGPKSGTSSITCFSSYLVLTCPILFWLVLSCPYLFYLVHPLLIFFLKYLQPSEIQGWVQNLALAASPASGPSHPLAGGSCRAGRRGRRGRGCLPC